MRDAYKIMGNIIKQVEIEKYNFYRFFGKQPTHIFINKEYLMELVKEHSFVILSKDELLFLGLNVRWIDDKGFSVGTVIKFDEVQDEHS